MQYAVQEIFVIEIDHKAGVRGNLFPHEFGSAGTFSLGTTYFKPVSLFPARGICSLFTCQPYRTSRYFVLHVHSASWS